ncbi:MAG: hypothetical protein QMD09_14460 [Desulfatibacillaceae bacterium]|nr:hypothetical protein [Desulfatibacillaceae bacterium]
MTNFEQTPHDDTEKGPDAKDAFAGSLEKEPGQNNEALQKSDLAQPAGAGAEKQPDLGLDLALNPELVQAINDAASQAGLAPEQAEKLGLGLTGYLTEAAGRQAAQKQQAIEELKGLWKETFDAKVATAVNAARAFGGQDFADFLNHTGLGDHPAMIRTFYAIGRALAEDSFSQGQPVRQKSGPARTEGGLPLLSFPSMK